MSKNINFDNMIKDIIKDNYIEIKPSRDIFEDSWNMREKTKNINIIKRFNYKGIAAAAIFLSLILGSTVAFVPSVRASVMTIFGLDSNGNIVEKSPHDKICVSTNWESIDENNKGEMESILEFKIDSPKVLGNYKLIDMVPIVITADVEYQDSDNILNKVNNEDHLEVYKELSKTYPMEISIVAFYVGEGGNEVSVGISKERDKKNKKGESIEIEGIKCSIDDGKIGKYPSKMITENSGVSDITKEPEIIDVKSISWNYNELNYHITFHNKESINDNIEFIKEYIRALKAEN